MLKKNALLMAIAVVFALGVGPMIANGQDEPERAAIKTSDGYLFVWNRPDLHFTISIKGTDIQPNYDNENVLFTVDGKLLQIQSLPVRNFLSDADRKGLDDKAILAAHREWEAKYLEGLLSTKLTVRSASEKLADGREALFWQFAMPEALGAEVKTQLYLTLVNKDFLVLLNTGASDSVPESAARKLLLDTLVTLKFSAVPFNLKEMQDSIRKGKGP